MINRVTKLREKLKDNEGVLISSKPNIFYYSGFTSADAMLYISAEKAAILTDSRYTVQAKLEAPDFEAVINNAKEYLTEITETRIYTEDGYLTAEKKEKLQQVLGEKELINGQTMISELRYIKDAEEISRIKAAEELGDAAFSHILEYIKPGMKENEVALELEFFMRKQGASRLSFTTICASGERSAMPHGTASDKIIKRGELFTMDFGCVLDGYCSDMTRTVIIGKPACEKQVEIYNTVLSAQLAALEALMPGLPCSEADRIARDYIKNAGYGECFGHSLGHSLGIEIHENPNLSEKSKDILTPGHVVTVEPGIYIEAFGGVRIEDVAAITETGYINLTTSHKELIIL